jgi:POT family proton-dependent oligopeptide transporter
MRALLVLFMVAPPDKGGLGIDAKVAAAIYGLYTAGVYLSALPGGWIADRLLGAQRAVWVGGILITLGHFTMAVPSRQTFFLGLVLIVIGTGLLKPNISALVGQLYPEGGARRDAGFTIFYMGINLGALIGPLICSALGEKVNWHYGFAAAGVGMVLGSCNSGSREITSAKRAANLRIARTRSGATGHSSAWRPWAAQSLLDSRWRECL